MHATLPRRRLALFALFFIPGLTIASWVTRTPAIRDLLQLSTAEMGLVLFGLSAGSMIGILASGPLVARLGARPLILAGTLGVILSMPTIGWGSATGAPLAVTAGLFVFGLGMGGSEIAMNVEGADIERGFGRPVLPALHGCFSLGTVVGATAGIGFTALAVPVVWHLGAVGAIATAGLIAAIPHVAPGVGIAPRDTAKPSRGGRLRSVLDGRLIIIGVVVLAMAFAEGTANDWLPLVMVDGHGFDPALGSAVYAVFAAAMTIGRFAGGPFIERFGRPAVLCASAVSGVVGLAIVIFVDHQVAAGAAVILWGLGASLGLPVALSVAGASGPDPATRVAIVATLGYVAFLVGPPLLGFIGEHAGLRSALLAPLALMAVAILLAPYVAERRSVERRAEAPAA
ncbi:MFS transporter [Leucobacter chromiiresistens]|uniref:Fucose permease n=1 Tax=Leucobacter chromiiresistens TaxID=1079994 RepID=A0A1H1A308_9MICO|nr:MFS transporter [Leucobacter chromiiresistens]SDQ33891.1 Fucose permease [Leucobacter chromiiresistens]